jgi:adenosine deaminase
MTSRLNAHDGGVLQRLLAKALIQWDHRVDLGAFGPLDAHLKPGFSSHLRNSFQREAGHLALTDIDDALSHFLRSYPTLVDWYSGLLSSDFAVDWHGGEPHITPSIVSNWECLSSDFDPDALLAFDLAYRCGSMELAPTDITNWKTIARVSDHELDVLHARGLSDLHVHVAGVRNLQIAWLELLSGEARSERYRGIWSTYSGARRSLGKDIDDARTAWVTLRANAGLGPVDRNLLRPTTAAWWRDCKKLLGQERWTLVSAWATILRAGEAQHELLSKLDKYLLLKNHFVRLVRQRTFAGTPGLRHFDIQLFSSLKKASAKAPYFTYGTSPRLEMAQHGDACRYLLESANLQRIELRISPFDRAAQYLRFFKLWEDLSRALRADMGRLPDIRYAIHFQRTREYRRGERLPDAEMKLSALDRRTAALRLALSDPDPEHRRWMSAVSRVDVAGQERDTPLAIFVKHLRLLRGESEAIAYLVQLKPGDPELRWFDCWRRLLSRRAHQPRPSDPKLGITVHAGEDFDDALDGLYQIGTAVDGLAMRAGDCIGHGLALVTDVAKSTTSRSMSVGAAHDSLCWLLHFIEQHDMMAQTGHHYNYLRELIRSTAVKIYDPLPPSLRGAEASDHVWVWQRRTLPVVSREDANTLRNALLRHNSERRVMARREQREPVDQDRRHLDELVRSVQARLRTIIIDRRIIIELNPSSNLRISGAASTGESPTVLLFKAVAEGLLACVNTDDPGIFGTCIENEYALLLEGVTRAGMAEPKARELLELVRKVGMETVYPPKRTGRVSVPAKRLECNTGHFD